MKGSSKSRLLFVAAGFLTLACASEGRRPGGGGADGSVGAGGSGGNGNGTGGGGGGGSAGTGGRDASAGRDGAVTGSDGSSDRASGSGGGGGGGSGGSGMTVVDGGRPDNGCVESFDLPKGPPPNVVIVLDRSGSMDQVPMTGTGNLWAQTTGAIRSIVMLTQSQIRWGIGFFPGTTDCEAEPIAVPVAADNYTPIDAAIARKGPGGATPTTDGINRAIAYLDTVADPGKKYIMLATDGAPNCAAMCTCPDTWTLMGTECVKMLCPMCGISRIDCIRGDDQDAAIAAVTAAANKGYHTYVVGLATSPTWEAVLDKLAEAGKEPRPGMPKYYKASDRADLEAAMRAIASKVISCEFALSTPPSDPDRTRLFLGGMSVPRDPTRKEGWEFGPGDKSVIFYGSWCQMVQDGTSTDVTAYFGCGTA